MSYYSEIKYDIDYRPENLRWNGWGSYDHDFAMGAYLPAIEERLRQELSLSTPLPATPGVKLEELNVPGSRLPAGALRKLETIAGRGRVSTDRLHRTLFSRGQSYYDLIRIRNNKQINWVDAVVFIDTERRLHVLLDWARRNSCALVPVGGASSVVGGVEALRGRHRFVLAVNLTPMAGLLEFDELSRVAVFGAGAYGPHVEKALNERGYTLGHFPQSFEYSTIGGWAAARSAGQQSNRYGKIEEMIVAVRVVTASGDVQTMRVPAQAAGPDACALFVGSEGLFGFITQVAVRIHRLPEERRYFAAYLPDFASGAQLVRSAADLGFSMLRLSDRRETELLEALSHAAGSTSLLRRGKHKIQELVLRAAGIGDGRCLLLFGTEGDREETDRLEAQARRFLSQHRGFFGGAGPGKNWLKGRFNMPFLRNHLMDRGIGVDTMETSVEYSRLHAVHDATIEALRKAGGACAAMGHISHSYHDGACLYFTIMFAMDARDPINQWRRIKKAATDAILSHGGSLSHHHGIGADHRPWFTKAYGSQISGSLAALKREFDPAALLNPEKLFDNRGPA